MANHTFYTMKKMVVLLILAALLLSIGAASAATSINVTAKSLTITSAPVPQFFGIITTNNTTINTFVTGEQTSLSKTLALLNALEIGDNIVTESNGVISAVA